MMDRLGRHFLRLGGAAVVLSTLLVASCKPKPGDSCKKLDGACTGEESALMCEHGKLAEASCKGPGGCQKSGTTVTCDDDIAESGDPCLVSETANYACTTDHAKALICEGGKFKLSTTCRGPKRCAVTHPGGSGVDVIDCDTSVAIRGEQCARPGLGACSSDFKQMLSCDNGVWASHRICRGQQGCQLLGLDQKTPACDESISQPGDPCGHEGSTACSTDQRTLLRCTGGQYTKASDCPRLGCHVASNGRPISG
jgi:hypothetical protein